METKKILTRHEHYTKSENGEYILSSFEEMEVEVPVEIQLTPEEKIKELEAKIELLLKNNE